MKSASAIFMSRAEAIVCLPQIITYAAVKKEWGTKGY